MKHPHLEEILNACTIVMGNEWIGKSRKQDFVFKRAIFYKVCRRLTASSTIWIGAAIGRDHATVLHGLKLHKNDIEKGYCDPDGFYKNLYERCLKLSERRLYKKKINDWTSIEKLLHCNINLRTEVERLKGVIKTMAENGYSNP